MVSITQTIHRSIAGTVVLIAAIIGYWVVGLARQSPTVKPSIEERDLRSLPDRLATLQAATGYPDWEHASGFSRSLTHHRRLRFHKDSNVFVSETGAEEGQVEVVEVILMPLDSESKVEFGIYDPKSGERLTHYPEIIKFDIFGIHGGSINKAPGVCITCHTERKPLIAIIPWSQTLEDNLKRSRSMGQGIRPDLIEPIPNDEESLQRLEAMNSIMQKKFPDQISDIRKWMTIRTSPKAGSRQIPGAKRK